MPSPPARVFIKTAFPSPVGALGAYVTPDPGDGARHPAIIWITGGESNTVADVWSRAPRANDQNAAAYRNAGIVMMFPSLRGGNDNPGRIEAGFGEIDDIIAAHAFLAALPYVDPNRIYLGGHSTGGTLAFLAAAADPRFRAVFAFGAVADSAVYAPDLMPVNYDALPQFERVVRAPIVWTPSVRTRVFWIEGENGNIDHLHAMRDRSANPNITFIEVPGADHFSVLAPANDVIAQKILADTGDQTAITLTAEEIVRAR